jgi:hypothetical protein
LAQREVDAILVTTFARIEECASIKLFDWLLAEALACPIAAVSHDAVLAGCEPGHFKPPFFVKSMGVRSFDPETLSYAYAGTPVQQAMRLMRGMGAVPAQRTHAGVALSNSRLLPFRRQKARST